MWSLSRNKTKKKKIIAVHNHVLHHETKTNKKKKTNRTACGVPLSGDTMLRSCLYVGEAKRGVARPPGTRRMSDSSRTQSPGIFRRPLMPLPASVCGAR
jgi:hypothetical protein